MQRRDGLDVLVDRTRTEGAPPRDYQWSHGGEVADTGPGIMARAVLPRGTDTAPPLPRCDDYPTMPASKPACDRCVARRRSARYARSRPDTRSCRSCAAATTKSLERPERGASPNLPGGLHSRLRVG